MHSPIRIAIVTGLAFTISACSGQHRGPADLDKDETLLQVSATGQSESKPDEANFAIGVSSIAATSEAATAANNAKINAVVAALKALDVRDADMQTRQVGASRVEWGANRNKFEANNSISIRMRDVSKAGAAIQAATRAGANILSGPDLRVSDPEAASRGAYTSAYKAARARADVYAEAAGMKVVRILAIRDGGGAPVPQATAMYDTAKLESADVAPPPVLAGTDRSQAGVSVDFVLGPK